VALQQAILNRPDAIFVLALTLLCLSTYVGAGIRRWRPLKDDERETFDVMVGATLTLLGLVIGFSFSIAGARYDQRKNDEVGEANAIGTELVRAELLPPDAAVHVRALLQRYLDERILFYAAQQENRLSSIDAATSQLQQQMWSVVHSVAETRPTPVVALVLSGMNDVLNAEGYTQAAWWYRLPEGAWGLMGAISIICCALIGYRARTTRGALLVLLPMALSIAFFFIADIDSPRHGVIQTEPHNLVRLAHDAAGVRN
jgi:hypothetical protein